MQYITLLIQLLPLAIQLIGALEGLPVPGAVKLKMLKDALMVVNGLTEKVWPLIETVVNNTVASMNAAKAVTATTVAHQQV